MNTKPVRVLQILIGGKTFSGVASYLYQYYKFMDTKRVHFDFLFCRENSMELVKNDPVLQGSNFFELHAVKGKSNDYRAIISGVRKILSEQHYDAIVVNTSIIAVIYSCMIAAKSQKNTVFIAHAHNTELILGKKSLRRKLGFIVQIADSIMRRSVRKNSDYLFACTNDAARVTFGTNVETKSNYRLVRNAIDVKSFTYNESVRTLVRNEFNTSEKTTVYGNVGSFCKRKNQLFLLDVFKEITLKNPDSELWLVGDGADKEMIVSAIAEKGLCGKVKLLGQRNDVNAIMQGMDCFVFSTISEGLGIVAIEAQAAGLYTVVSDGVPTDVLISDHVCQLKLAEGAKAWANHIIDINLLDNRVDETDVIKKAGYEIQVEAEKMTNFFSLELV